MLNGGKPTPKSVGVQILETSDPKTLLEKPNTVLRGDRVEQVASVGIYSRLLVGHVTVWVSLLPNPVFRDGNPENTLVGKRRKSAKLRTQS